MDAPPWAPGLFDELAALRCGARVQILTEAGIRETYVITLRCWCPRTDRITAVTLRRFDSAKHWLATPQGWKQPKSTTEAA